MARTLLPRSNSSTAHVAPARDRSVQYAASVRAAARLLAIGQTVLAAGGCATILGIDHDYGDRPDKASKPGAAGASAGETAGAGAPSDGTSTGGKSSSGGTSSEAGSGPGPSEGGAAGQGSGGTGGSSPGGASSDAGSSSGGASSDAGSSSGGASSDAGSGPGGPGGEGNTGGSDAGVTGGGGGITGGSGSGTGGARGSTGGTGGAATGGSGLGGASTGTGGASSTGGQSASGGSAGSAGSGGASPAATKVQSGSATIPAESTTVQVSIDPIDSSKAFLVFGTRFDSSSPGLTCVSGQISSNDQLTFTHETAANAPAIPIHYYVAEFPNGVTVQRGSHLMSTMSETVTLPASVDLATSFPIVTFRNTGLTYSMDDFVRAKLTSSAELSLSASDRSGRGTVEWQVVSFDGAAVQSGDLDITSDTTLFSATLAEPVDPARTWLLLSYEVSDLGGGASELMLTGRVDSSTELAFERAETAPASAGQLTYYAVSFDGANVQSATRYLSSVATDTAALGSPVDPTKAIAAAAGIYQRGGTTSYTTESNPGHATFTLDLGTGTQLSLARGATDSDASADYYVIELP
ncbi:MAG: hypothetical protein JW940_13540 [Polyangiaceae bacterium]|nr:hypothetical protein [Polyangiaceae bacterium]